MEPILEKFHHDAINNPERKLYDFLDCGDDEFLHDVVTVKGAWEKARDIAYELKAKGAKKGDRAIILCMQDCGTVYSIWGCMIAGVVFTVIPPPLDQSKLDRFISVLKSCSPKFLISNEAMEKSSETKVTGPLLKKAFREVISLKRIYTDKVASHPEFTDVNKFDKEDLIYLQYTSGSTSAPKGVMVTYGNLLACIDQCLEFFDFTKGDHNLGSWVPFYHNIGLIVAIFLPIIAPHGISYFIPTLQFLAKPTIWLKALSDYKINITAAPNSAYEVLTRIITPELAKEYDLKHVTHLINGSEFVDPFTVDKFCSLFGLSKDVFAPGYGLSECVCVASVASQDYKLLHIDRDEYRQGRFVVDPTGTGKPVISVGKVAGNTLLVAVRKDGSLCGENEIGELYMQGDTVCAGYYKNPEETKRYHAKVNGLPGDFFRTGDMGYIHEGRVFLTGRIKEMIIISGKNLFPNDITALISDSNIDIPRDAMAVFALLHEGVEVPVLCAEISSSIKDKDDAMSVAMQINKAVSNAFGFSFRDIVLVEKGTLPRTDNRKVKTLETKRRYKDRKLNEVFSLLHGDMIQETSTKDVFATLPKLTKDSSIDDIKSVLRQIFNEFLPGVEFSDNDSFLELGADSLTMTRLVTSMEQYLGMPIDLRALIDEPTIDGISDYIRNLLLGEDIKSKINLYDECKLPEDIVLKGDYDIPVAECKNILLTGATGFLGAYTISALIEEHKDKDICIYAHGRAKNTDALMDRIVFNLKRFNCYKKEYEKYIIPITGELTKPKLGMDEKVYNRLSNEIHMVIHNGAVLNFLLSYDKLKDANVGGTVEALRFAMEGRAKYFHYISSYSVYDNPSHFKKTVSEDDNFDSGDGYFLGYSETKWVSEKLVTEAKNRGLKTVIYRPGDITGTMSDGIWKLEDLISRSIVGCVQLNAVPDMDVHLHLTPVDYVAAVISHVLYKDEAIGHGVNIINKFIRPMSDIIKLMKRYGYKAEILPYEEWCDRLTKASPEENVLRVLSCLFTDKKPEGENLHERFGSYQAEFSTQNCDKYMSDTNVSCPPMNEKMLKVYLNNFHKAGYIKKPTGFLGFIFG